MNNLINTDIHRELIFKSALWHEEILKLDDPYTKQSEVYKIYLFNLIKCCEAMIYNIK